MSGYGAFHQHSQFSQIHNNSYQNMNINPLAPSHQYKKIFCAYHRTEFLTNFCIEKQCLMPMCPSCVAEHTEYHNKSQQRPNYINLQQALQQVKQRCYTMIINLQDSQRRNQQILTHIEDLPDYLHQQLTAVKDQIFEHIEDIFHAYEADILKDIQKKYEQGRVYNRQQSQDIRSAIIGCIDSLYDKIGILKGDQCLAGLITYYGQDMKSYKQAVQDIDQYLNRHRRNGKIAINLNKTALAAQLDDLCKKTLNPVMFVDENVAYEPLNENSMIKRTVHNNNQTNNSRVTLGNRNTSVNMQQIAQRQKSLNANVSLGQSHQNSQNKLSSLSFNNRPSSRVNINQSGHY